MTASAPLPDIVVRPASRASRSSLGTRPARRPVATPLPWPSALVIAVLMTLGYATELSPAIAQTGGISWRLGALAIGALAVHAQVAPSDVRRFAKLFGPFLLSLALLVVVSPDSRPDRMADLLRQLFLVIIGGLAFASGRDATARRRIQLMLLYAAAITAVLAALSALPVLRSGWSYAAARQLKMLSTETQGFGANAGCFGALIALMASYRSSRGWPWLHLGLGLGLAVLSVVLTVRAPIAALILACAIAAILARSRKIVRLAGWPIVSLAIVMAVLALVVSVFLLSVDAIAHSHVAAQLAGRAALWQIGMAGWLQHPLTGNGPGSMVDVIHRGLGAATLSASYEAGALYALSAGGFHNIWINTLVERGLIGFVGFFLSYALLLAAGLRRAGTLPRDRRFVLLVILLFASLRAFVEVAGLMTVGTAPLEGLMIIAIGIAIGPDSRERSGGRRSAPLA